MCRPTDTPELWKSGKEIDRPKSSTLHARVAQVKDTVEAEADALMREAVTEKRRQGPVCTVTATGKRELVDALVARGLQSSVIGRLMQKRGIPITPWVIQRHRRGDCTCQTS